MALGPILIGFLYALLYCAIIILIAFVFLWGWRFIMGSDIDANVYKWGRVVIGLLCAIVLISWLLSALGLVSGGPFPFHVSVH
jgi:hypothetical protein